MLTKQWYDHAVIRVISAALRYIFLEYQITRAALLSTLHCGSLQHWFSCQ